MPRATVHPDLGHVDRRRNRFEPARLERACGQNVPVNKKPKKAEKGVAESLHREQRGWNDTTRRARRPKWNMYFYY